MGTATEWLTGEVFNCPVGVCECVNKLEVQRKGNRRITKKVFVVFHQCARPKCLFLSKGKEL